MYSSTVIDHFARPRHSGVLPSAEDVIEGRAGDREQGVQFRLTARISGPAISGHRIGEARAAVYGCPHCIAAASWLAERLPGMTWEQLRRWRWHEVDAALEVPTEKRGRLLVLEDAVRALAAAWEAKQHPGAHTS